MLATLVYLADEAAENFCGKVTLDLAVRQALPVGSAALPRHISLGTVHAVKDFEHYLQLAARVAEKLEPLTVELTVADTVTTPDGKTGWAFTLPRASSFPKPGPCRDFAAAGRILPAGPGPHQKRTEPYIIDGNHRPGAVPRLRAGNARRPLHRQKSAV